MGQDKALMPFLGRPLIERVIARVAPIANEIWITTNHPEAYQQFDIPLAPDLLPGRGALGGLYTALSAARSPLAAVVACDMPFANPDVLRACVNMLDDKEIAAVVPRHAGGAEPFHAVYRREICLPAIASALQADKWRADAWFSAVRVDFLEEDRLREIDPSGLAFLNLNTPEELGQAEKIARQMAGE